MGENINKGERASPERTNEDRFKKKRVGMHDGKESGKNVGRKNKFF